MRHHVLVRENGDLVCDLEVNLGQLFGLAGPVDEVEEDLECDGVVFGKLHRLVVTVDGLSFCKSSV